MKIETGRVCPVLSLPQHTNKPMFSYVFIKTKVEKIELKIEEIGNSYKRSDNCCQENP